MQVAQVAQVDHSQIGDVREFAGIKFTATQELKTFDGRPRGIVWEAGPISSRIDEAWESSTGHRFQANGVHSRTFEQAAIRALKGEAARARKARAFLLIYDAPELAEARAKVDNLG